MVTMGEKARDVNPFCTQCGTPNPEHDIFCGSCGINMEKQATPIQTTAVQAPQYESPPIDRYATPSPQMYYGNQMHSQLPYLVRWQDASKITIGVLLMVAGLSFGWLGLVFIALDPFIGLMLLLLLTVIPIFIGFSLLKSFMGGWDMIKTSISSFIAGFVIYLYGIFVFIFMIFVLFDGFYF